MVRPYQGARGEYRPYVYFLSFYFSQKPSNHILPIYVFTYVILLFYLVLLLLVYIGVPFMGEGI